MRIAQIAPLIERVPPKKYGGTERVVYALTEELVKKGHDVTLFASGDSVTSANLLSVFPKSLREIKAKSIYADNLWSMLNIGLAYEMQEEFDIIHDHNGYLSLPVANLASTPVVSTMHGAFTRENIKLYQALKNPHIVTISNAQLVLYEGINHVGTVYNGLNMEHYPFRRKDDGYLLYVGRISLEKGAHIAVRVAKKLGLPLILAAKLEDVDKDYFEEEVKPFLNEKIVWIGEVGSEERNNLMSKAICLLHPITWREPFGLTMIESMACGCPVVAFGKGAVAELVVDGKTGYVVSNAAEMTRAVLKIKKIRRSFCRKHALTKFTAKRMAEGYLRIYEKLIDNRKSRHIVGSSVGTGGVPKPAQRRLGGRATLADI